jgi:asparagine synthase (glutamine-hydrolysing)
MCGIAGLIADDVHSVPDDTRTRVRSSIRYRGLDDQGEWSDGRHICLFHSRLSIIDHATGHQPMCDISNRYVIVYNGEIFNYRELRTEYERQGAQFKTQSDTEVVLEGFKLKGDRILGDLNGMFAFAIWDTKEKILAVARDHLGKKPLYWFAGNGVFYFSSTMDAFTHAPGWTGKLSTDSLWMYGKVGSFPEDLTVYEDVHCVPYATYGTLRLGETEPHFHRYWRMKFATKSNQSLGELIDEYENILTDAISIRLRSDVPVAISFSGGVDSGTIAAICAQKLNSSIVCYTIDYHTPEDPSDETVIAEKAARHLGLDWRQIQFDYHTDLLKDLQECYRYYDQPCVQIALVYSDRLYRTIKHHATVVLSGNGADELFTGYIGDEEICKRDIRLARLRRVIPLLKIVEKARLDRFSPFSRLSSSIRWMEAAVSGESFFKSDYPVSDRTGKTLEKVIAEIKQSGVDNNLDGAMQNGLTYGTTDSNYRIPDISGLTAQVEVRSPFLDHRLVEFACRLPHRFKVADVRSPLKNKYLPKLYYERKVPSDIAWSSKKGMGMNLRFDKSIVLDPVYIEAFTEAYQGLEKMGMDCSAAREAWLRFREGNQESALQMMAGFMLRHWLQRQ